MFCHHEDRCSIEIQVRSLFQDRTASWVRIVNGVEKYVNETIETIEDEERGALGKPIAEARPRVTLTPVSVPPRERKWVDVNPGSYDHECSVISEAMIRLLPHDQNIPPKPTEQIRGCFAMVTQRSDCYSGRRRRSHEKVSTLLEP